MYDLVWLPRILYGEQPGKLTTIFAFKWTNFYVKKFSVVFSSTFEIDHKEGQEELKNCESSV